MHMYCLCSKHTHTNTRQGSQGFRPHNWDTQSPLHNVCLMHYGQRWQSRVNQWKTHFYTSATQMSQSAPRMQSTKSWMRKFVILDLDLAWASLFMYIFLWATLQTVFHGSQTLVVKPWRSWIRLHLSDYVQFCTMLSQASPHFLPIWFRLGPCLWNLSWISVIKTAVQLSTSSCLLATFI